MQLASVPAPATTTIPGPKGHFLTGSLSEARARPLEYVLELARRYGPLCQVRLGPTKLVIVSSPELVKHVLQEQSAHYGRPALVALMRRLVGNGLLFAEGEQWLRQRRLMQPGFHRERIAGFARTMAEVVERRITVWRDRSGQLQDISASMQQLSLEIVGRTLFSSELGRHADQLGPAIQTMLAWLNERSANPIAAPLIVPTAANRRFRAAQVLLTDHIAQLIGERRGHGHRGRDGRQAPHVNEDPGDLLSMLLLARDADTGEAMTDVQVHDELVTFIIAGYETTSSALEWTLILLAQHPAWAERVRREKHAVCGSRAPTPADLPNMPVARMVIDEALRLYPPAFGLTRRALQDTELGGYSIARGTQVLVSPFALHRNPALWRDPEHFDPERFSPAHSAERHRYAHVPFGAGPRQCIGHAFAMMELQVLVPSLLGALRFELSDRADITPQARMTLRPRGPVLMRVTSG